MSLAHGDKVVRRCRPAPVCRHALRRVRTRCKARGIASASARDAGFAAAKDAAGVARGRRRAETWSGRPRPSPASSGGARRSRSRS